MTVDPPTDAGIIALAPVDDRPDRWRFLVEERLCAGPRGQPFLFGGAALAAALAALERSVGRPPIWANAQYHGFAVPGTTIDFTVEAGRAGRRLSQARVVGEADGRMIVSVQATLGTASAPGTGQWIDPPRAPGWRDCPVVHDHRIYQTGINTHFDFRLARGRYPDGRRFDLARGDGRVELWVRPLDRYPIDRPMLAVVADYVSLAICDALGVEIGANSLDNSIRFIADDAGRLPIGDDDRWLLADIAIDAIAGGIAHGGVRLFAESGALLATAATSLILRA